MLATVLRVGGASALAVAPGAAGLWLLGDAWHRGVAVEAATVAASALLAAALGYVAMRALGVEELRAIEDLARSAARRLSGRRGPG